MPFEGRIRVGINAFIPKALNGSFMFPVSFARSSRIANMDDTKTWPEVEKAAAEKRRELVLQGPTANTKISSYGGLPSAIYSLTLLNYLEVSQCPNLTELHEDIQYLTNLQSLILCRNKLSCIPDVINNLKSLKVLDLSANNLVFLPDGITQLRELTTLNVSCNRLEALPDGLSHCVKLCSINMSKNRITGFPSDLYSERMDLLSTLVASDNAIVELGTDIHKLAALKVKHRKPRRDHKKTLFITVYCNNSIVR